MDLIEGFSLTLRGRIHYVEKGQGEPLLLLHSNGCSLHEFAPTMNELAKRYRCIAWDMPGHGDSDPPGTHQSVPDYADSVLAFMDAMHLDKAHICGASIGGLVCIALGVIAPQRVLSLVIAEAALRSEHEWAAQWPRIEAMFATPQQSQEDVAPRFRQLTPALFARWNIDRHKVGGWRMVDVMWAIREFDAQGHLSRLQCPSVVVIGDRGPVLVCKPLYQKLLPAAHLIIMSDAGHFPMLDDPNAFAQAVHEGIGAMSQGAST